MNRTSDPATSTGSGDESPCDHPLGSAAPLDSTLLERAAEFFRAAGDVERLRLLAELDRGERCVTDLAALTGEGMSTVSQRLKVLRAAGLVARRRDHKHILYSLADVHIAQLIRSALDHAGELESPRHPTHAANRRPPSTPQEHDHGS